MAQSLANLNVKLGFIFDTRSLAAVEKSLQRTGDRLARTGQNISLFISAPLAILGGNAIKAAGEFESLSLAMQATFKNAGRTIAEANLEVEALRKAALAPGLDFPQAVAASIRLQSVGQTAEDARGIIVELANAIASTGGTAQQLESVTVQMAQMISKGKVLSGDLRIIQENLPIISDLMLKAFGTSNAEKIQELGITGKEFVSKITVEMQKLTRVSGGISNALVNAKSAITQALAGIGNEINKVFNISALSDKFSESVKGVVAAFAGLSDGVKKAIIVFAALLAALGPIALVMSGISSVSSILVGTFASLAKSFNTLKIAILGVDAAIGRLKLALGIVALVVGLGVAIYSLSENFDAAEFAAQKFSDAQKEIVNSTAAEVGAINKAFSVLKDTTKTYFERGKALDALKSQYPEYLRGIEIETVSIAKLTDIQNGLNASILRGVAERQKAAAVTSIYEEQAKILLRIQQLRDGQKVTASEAGLIDTGEMLRAGSIAAAVIQKMEAQATQLGTQVGVVSGQFDKAFGTMANAVDPALKAEYDLRDAAESAREAIELGIKSNIRDGDAVEKTALSKKELAAIEKARKETLKDTVKAEIEEIANMENYAKMIREIEQAWKDEEIAANSASLAAAKADDELRALSVGAIDTTENGPAGAQPLESPGINLSDPRVAEDLKKIAEEAKKAQFQLDAIALAGEGIASIGSIISETLANSAASFKEFAAAAIAAIGDVIGKLIQLAVANAFTGALKEGAKFGPIGVAIAAITGGLAAAAFKKIVSAAHFAKGTGDAPGGLAIVGEKGAELINLPRHSQVFPAHETRSMLSDIGGGGALTLDGEFTMRGSDMVLLMERVLAKQTRGK